MASQASCGRSIPRRTSQSSSSRVLWSGKRAWRSSRATVPLPWSRTSASSSYNSKASQVPAVVRSLADEFGILAAHGGQLEFAAVRLEHGSARGVAHDAPCSSSRSKSASEARPTR